MSNEQERQLRVEVVLDNAAFVDSGEVARILRALADSIVEYDLDLSFFTPLLDVNGNRVGQAHTVKVPT